MTLSVLEGHSPIASVYEKDFRTVVDQLTRYLLASCSPSSIAELLVYMVLSNVATWRVVVWLLHAINGSVIGWCFIENWLQCGKDVYEWSAIYR